MQEFSDKSTSRDAVTIPVPPALERGRIRWQWYHYYFLLAFVDLIVIAAGVWMIHRTTNSYELALQKLAATHARQRWIANLRLLVMNLNAPGNDVFETRRIAEERQRFGRHRADLLSEMQRKKEMEVDLAEFQGHLTTMIQEEQLIFDLLERSTMATATGESVRHLQDASRAMAAMDRHQTAAVTALTEIEQGFLMRVESLLKEHGAILQLHVALERVIVGLIVLILIGMFWYGRKLQRLHEEMMLHHQRAITERLARLAAVGEVCTAVAHGIRNPLATISSSAQLALAAGGGDQTTRSRMEDILSECRRLDGRVTHLLSFASEAATAHERFELRGVVDQAVTELASRLQERQIDVQISFASTAWIKGDRERMVQCMIELLSNALEYSPIRTPIKVECRPCEERDGYVDLIVSDRGPGIPLHVAGRVFDLFFTTRPEGTGIGLASVRHAIHSHGGEVGIIPDANQGTRVRITLPLSK